MPYTKKPSFTIAFMVILMVFMTGCASVSPAFQASDEAMKSTPLNTIAEKQVRSEDEAVSITPEANVTLDDNRIIQDKSFDVKLKEWGNVRFISYAPGNSIDSEDISFFLVKDDTVVYTFPQYYENNSTQKNGGLYDSVTDVEFRDVNNDTFEDVIVLIYYITGAGPQGMIPRPSVRIFLADGRTYILATALMNDITENIQGDLTIAGICDYINTRQAIA